MRVPLDQLGAQARVIRLRRSHHEHVRSLGPFDNLDVLLGGQPRAGHVAERPGQVDERDSNPVHRVRMPRVVKIYTRKGDDGSTGLWYGGRVLKSDPRPEAYGSVDEAGCALGLCRAAASDHAELQADILRIQSELYVAGAELATAPEAADRLEEGISKVTSEMVERLEADIDRYMEQVDLPPKFVIPGGTELSARLDLARSTIRRAERRVVDLQCAGELADDTLLRYLNRASDALFAMARFADESQPELFRGRG
jgi:cob(I)alamin adenosyltransferase